MSFIQCPRFKLTILLGVYITPRKRASMPIASTEAFCTTSFLLRSIPRRKSPDNNAVPNPVFVTQRVGAADSLCGVCEQKLSAYTKTQKHPRSSHSFRQSSDPSLRLQKRHLHTTRRTSPLCRFRRIFTDGFRLITYRIVHIFYIYTLHHITTTLPSIALRPAASVSKLAPQTPCKFFAGLRRALRRL